MFLAPDGDEIEVTSAAAAFMADAMPMERFHETIGGGSDLTPDLRAQFGEMGWFALALPEAKGGSGLSAVEHTLFFREVGRLCGPIDLLVQALALHVADDDVRGALASGEQSVTLAVPDRGRLRLLGAGDAAFALEVDREGAKLRDLAAAPREARVSFDLANSMHLIDESDAPVIASCDGPEIWQLGELGVAAMQLGLAEAALDMIVDYAKIRETFGRKIGSYQAVRHPCADMALRAETARCQIWYAAAAVKEGRSDAAMHIDAAKHLANQAALANTDANIQLHGGIGITDEHNAHLLMKHAWVLAKLFGSKRALLGALLHARVED